MIFTVNQKQYSFPSTLRDISTGQRISFADEHGQVIEKKRVAIALLESTFEKELESEALKAETAVRTISFYSGIPFDEAKSKLDILDLLHIYNTSSEQLSAEEEGLELQPFYEWKGDNWFPAIPELSPTNAVSVREYALCANVVQALYKLSKNKWDLLPYLCAIYLRKNDEPFADENIQEGSDRLALMRELPLDIALSVCKYLLKFIEVGNTIVHNDSEII